MKKSKVKSQPLKPPPKKAPITDARNKIISKKRTQITDAREKLAQLAKQKDARLKLEKLRQERVSSILFHNQPAIDSHQYEAGQFVVYYY